MCPKSERPFYYHLMFLKSTAWVANSVDPDLIFCLCWGFTAKSTQWRHCQGWLVYLTTLLLGRLSPLSRWPVLCTFFHHKNDSCCFWISGSGRMTVENISWSICTKECCQPCMGWIRNLLITSRMPIQMSHQGWQTLIRCCILWHLETKLFA